MVYARVASFSLNLNSHRVFRHASLRPLSSSSEIAVPEIGPDPKGQWRPSVDDVVRISWGKPAKQKGTGSRGVPHRLNQDERVVFDFAVSKGFLEVAGSGWRKQRREAPLVNTYRSFCDAARRPVIVVFKGSTGEDEVSLDFSPLRRPDIRDQHLAVARAVAASPSLVQLGVLPGQEAEDGRGEEAAGGVAQGSGSSGSSGSSTGGDREEGPSEAHYGADSEAGDSGDGPFEAVVVAGAEAGPEDWLTRPIYQLPWVGLTWPALARPAAKKLAKELAAAWIDAGEKGGNNGAKAGGKKGGRLARESGSLAKGMPNVKPGKSRRHGGYGIG
eukprot:CAMPEP_0172589742 /NCGR_PEP_ID=MMETSP1068-20121228/8348_1 /TAXON_ID=35684 /ORGANISM="Pseudopedinella elastica, Strain CCMP716" /LENGTH=329 /DNA_ID=CAMNT_0013385389 /DNA_START=215 /DNA_END=1204 /DNA_ORIENTATION=+